MAEENPKKSEPKASPDARSSIAKREEEILQFWQENNIFEKSLEKPAPKGEFVFYDGPPFATGLPHYGSLLSSVVKDVIPRYKTMQGYHVRRRWGWDCHGLPIENMIEKRLGLKDKTEIEKIGIKKFNETCRASVLEYATEWKRFIDRIARWVEYDNAYMTMDATYTESVWWGLKQIFEKGLLYEGRKVLLYCPHCQTPLAKAEIQMDNSYKDVTEEAVTVKFKVKAGQKVKGNEITEESNLYFLAWTTTPWTLPGNVALAVNGDVTYAVVDYKRETYIITDDLVEKFFDGQGEVVYRMKGSELVGLEYEPLYKIEAVKETGKKAWYVSDADFVTTEEGTGIVHTAVIYGEDDYELGIRLDLPMVPLLDEKGHFTEKAPELIQGMYFKKAENTVKEDLESRELLFKKESHTHSYPHCHRCGTSLLYNALTSWFLDIQKIKKRMIELNEKINWIPEHLKHGRFLNILESAPDWTISRNRYWASPLPIWRSVSGKTEVIGSLQELKEKTRTSNKYFVMRHGEADGNASGLIQADPSVENGLTDKGRKESREASLSLGDTVDVIYTSSFPRTKETAEVVAETLNIPKNKIITDERIGEMKQGELEGKMTWKEFNEKFSTKEQFEKSIVEGGETRMDVKRRAGEFMYEISQKHENEKILIITHGAVIGALNSVVEGADIQRSIEIEEDWARSFSTGEVHELDFVPLPHNDDYELDFHRPYIDEIKWLNEEGELMERIPEVVDGWVEAASMPFAEYHYPFENKENFEKRFPGDFVAEYIAQTRTWFYYMLVISTFLFDDVAFKNVVTTGNILAEDGSKMSKSKGNYTDPMINLDRYGADALRYYFMTSVVMQAEDVRFMDEEVKEIHSRLINILWNTFKFYDMYAPADLRGGSATVPNLSNVLDKWIVSRLNQLNRQVTQHLDEFNTVKSGRPIRDFVQDFSQWYVRRSRDRFKSDDAADMKSAVETARFVLHELSRLSAPFMPYISEEIYRGIGGGEESVHLENWPEAGEVDEDVIENMEEVRQTVSLALEARADAGIKVRQPLSKLKVQSSKLKGEEDLIGLIKDEVNIKEVVFDESIKSEVELDTEITEELKREGQARDLIRQLQSMRKKAGLTPEDVISVAVETNDAGQKVIKEFEEEIKTTANIEEIKFENVPDGESLELENVTFKLRII